MTRDEVIAQSRNVIRLWETWSRPGDKEPADVRAARATIRLLGKRRRLFARS